MALGSLNSSLSNPKEPNLKKKIGSANTVGDTSMPINSKKMAKHIQNRNLVTIFFQRLLVYVSIAASDFTY